MQQGPLHIELRPKCFEEVIGLGDQIALIKNKIDGMVQPPNFFLTGPYGTGKTTLGMIIARYIQGWDFEGEPQVREINGAHFRGIDDMRQLVDTCNSFPLTGKYAVILLDEVHQITRPAQELLLKATEVKNSPTIWILATTNPEKIIQGIQDRFTTVKLTGMTARDREALVKRAAEYVKFEGDPKEFLAAITKAELVSPRQILKAFSDYQAGYTIKAAIGNVKFETSPELFTIARAACFGKWSECAALLTKLEDSLKAKPKVDGEAAPAPEAPVVADAGADQSDVDQQMGKVEAAQSIRMITAAMLKNQMMKCTGLAPKAAAAMKLLLIYTPQKASDTGLEFSSMVANLYMVNKEMKGDK